MTCPSRDIWRSFLDYKLDDQENERPLVHLQSCGICPQVVEAMIAEEKTLMEALLEIPGEKEELPVGQEACPPPEALWDYAEKQHQEELLK